MQQVRSSGAGVALSPEGTGRVGQQEAEPRGEPRWWAVGLLLLLITVLGAGLRLARLDRPSVWNDELYSVRDASRLGRGETFGWTRTISYVPVWFSLKLNGISPGAVPSHSPEQWRAMGVDENAIRMGPALLGLATVPILGLVAAQVFGWRIGLIAAGLLAIAPWHIYWSQGGRFYGMQFLFYNLAFLWYFKGVLASRTRYVALAMGMMLIAAMTQPTALVFGFIAVGDWLITKFRRRPSGLPIGSYVALCCGFGLGAAMLWVDMGTEGPVQVPMAEPAYLKLFVGSIYFIGPAVVGFALLAGWMLLRNGEARAGWYLVLGGVVPIIIFTLLSFRAYAGTRYMFYCLFAWLLLAAIGADYCYRAVSVRWGAIGGLAPLAAIVVPMLVADVGYFTVGHGLHPRYREAYGYVRSHRQEGEPVACNRVSWIARYYLETGNVVPVSGPGEMAGFQRPAWLVTVHTGPGRGWERWSRAGGDLRGRYEVWSQMPIASVSVFHYANDE